MRTNTQKSNTARRLLSYGIVGASAFATEFISFLGLYSLFSGSYRLFAAQTLSFMFGLVVSFFGSRLFTFKKGEGYQLKLRTQMAAYVSLALLNILISNFILHLLVHTVGVFPIYAKVIVMGMVVVWNFTLFNRFIFKSKRLR